MTLLTSSVTSWADRDPLSPDHFNAKFTPIYGDLAALNVSTLSQIGATPDAGYVLTASNASLPASGVLTAGSGVILATGSAVTVGLRWARTFLFLDG